MTAYEKLGKLQERIEELGIYEDPNLMVAIACVLVEDLSDMTDLSVFEITARIAHEVITVKEAKNEEA